LHYVPSLGSDARGPSASPAGWAASSEMTTARVASVLCPAAFVTRTVSV
jgi:hypothetical protein